MTAQNSARHRVETDILFGLDAVIVTGKSSQFDDNPEEPAAISLKDVHTLGDLEEHHASECPYCQDANEYTRIVFGKGPEHATLMCIGGAPGETENQTGIPCAGPAGDLLAKMLKPMGFAQGDVYLTSILKTMPPENKRPRDEDSDLCGIWLQRQIELINPTAIVALGGLAANFLLGSGEDISLLRGKWGSFSSSDRPIPVMPTYHPAFVLEHYTQEVRGEVWSDLQQVMEKLKEVSSQI